MLNSDAVNNSRWPCSFSGCEKSFARKEHLTRHERTHAPGDNLYVCKVCLQKFNRSDSLQRHLARHGDDYKPYPSGRSKKACIKCHKGKIKCDGNHPCSKCRSRGTSCRYEQEDQPVIIPPREALLENAEVKSTSQVPDARAQSPQNIEFSSFFHGITSDLNSLEFEPRQNHMGVSSELSPADLSRNTPPIVENIKGKRLGDLTTIRIRKDPPPRNEDLPIIIQAETSASGKSPPNLTEGFEARYQQLYFFHFHHRWPIMHRPAYEDQAHHLISRSTVFMIGGWLSGTVEGKQYALAMHDYLLLHISTELSNRTSADVFHDTLPSSLCQAALVNIVFALHTGAETQISKVVVIRNTLVAVLREVGFFDPSTIWADEKPGYFLPLHLSLLGERQRMAAYLFRVDIYLSLIRGPRSLLSFNELHYSLPSTHASWNADGLDTFAERAGTEPALRSRTSMWTRIKDFEQRTEILTEDPMLIEDIQLFMCVIQPQIAHFWDRMRSSCYSNDSAILRAECPRPRLEALKRQLDLISLQLKNPIEPGISETLPSIHYHGYEEPTEPSFQNVISGRMKDLLFDALMIYHLLQMQLNTDIQIFSQIAKDRNVPLAMRLPEARRQEREQRVSSATTWTSTCLARRALYHAVEVLVLHQQNKEIETRTMDPIGIVALVNAALIVWAYCTSSGAETPDDSNPHGPYLTELTEWCNGDPSNKGAREMWIDIGMGLPVEIWGVRVCNRNTTYLVANFRAFIPDGWELADTIAPGIFKGH